MWLGRAAMQYQTCDDIEDNAMWDILSLVESEIKELLKNTKSGTKEERAAALSRRIASGVAVNAIGMTLSRIPHWEAMAFEDAKPGQLAIRLAQEWRQKAVKAIRCFLWMAKKEFRFPRDLRIKIADMIWVNRAPWHAFAALPAPWQLPEVPAVPAVPESEPPASRRRRV